VSEKVALVTGAAGFIGSHLSERLIGEGWRVRGVDCFTNYYDPALKERNLGGLRRAPRFDLSRLDLRTTELAPFLVGVDCVWHLAAQAGVRASWGAEFQTYSSINIEATQRVLEAAVEARTARVVYASSSSVYGDAPEFPADEKSVPAPISPYGVTKLAGEHLMALYQRAYGLPTISLRYFTVYGPRQRPDMGFHKFLRAIYEGRPLPIFGDGTQTRDFTFIADAIEANFLAERGGVPGRAYNVSGGSRLELNEVLGRFSRTTGRPVVRENLPMQKGDPANTGGSAARAREELGFIPRTDLRTGLSAQAAWMQRYLEGAAE